MNYKETLYFVAKCLTISLVAKNRQEVEKELKLKSIDWEAVVKVSTNHYVFPTMYCNLKRANFLKYLPVDLVLYMKNIADLNRNRNEQILQQAQELNRLLLTNNIKPVFLKGTGNLLAGLYEDLAERMVGDIDFIFSKEDYLKAISVLRNNGYSEVTKKEFYLDNKKKHYRRLQKQNNIAAIEIHRDFLNKKKYNKEFNFKLIEKDSQVIDKTNVLSYSNKLNLSIIANQINDHGFYYKTIALRNAYDVFLLSKKTSAKDAMIKLDKLSHPLNCFLAACYDVFNKVDSLEYNKTKKTLSYLNFFSSQLNNQEKTIKQHNRIKSYLALKNKLNILYKSILYKEYRVWLFSLLKDKNWYKRKLNQLGFFNSNK